MKNIIVQPFLKTILFLLLTTSLKAQITEITAIDSFKYKIGDKIKMGKAMNELPKFSFAIQYDKNDFASTIQEVSKQVLDSLTIISISESPSVKGDYTVECSSISLNNSPLNYSFIFNKAIETGEVISKNPKYFVAPSSEEALKQLKKAKEKLDLGLITKDEYDKKVNELKKYIDE